MARPRRRDRDFAARTRPHLDALFRTALRLTGSVEAAEDLVQETCLKACRALGRFQPGTNYRAWLFRIMKNSFIDAHQRKPDPATGDWELVQNQAQARSATADSPQRSPEVLYLHKNFRRDALRAMSDLAPDVRLVTVLILVEGFSYAEVARIADCPVGTVRSRLSRGRRRLRETLKDYAAVDRAETADGRAVCDEVG